MALFLSVWLLIARRLAGTFRSGTFRRGTGVIRLGLFRLRLRILAIGFMAAAQPEYAAQNSRRDR